MRVDKNGGERGGGYGSVLTCWGEEGKVGGNNR